MRIESRKEADHNVWDVQADVSDLVAHRDGRAFTLQEPATLAAKVLEAGGSLTVERFAVESAFGKVSGEGDLDRGVNWTATVDLDGAQRQLHDLVDLGTVELSGNGRASGNLRRTAEGLQGTIAAEWRDLDSLQAGDDPAIRLNLKANYQTDADRLDLAEMALVGRYASLDASGSLSDLSGRRLADLKGTWTPNWEEVTALAAREIDPGVQLSGGSSRFEVQAELGDGSADEVRKTLVGELGVELSEAQFFGLRLGPTPLVLRAMGERSPWTPSTPASMKVASILSPSSPWRTRGGRPSSSGRARRSGTSGSTTRSRTGSSRSWRPSWIGRPG